jgi:hypothetical protein
VPLEPPKEVAIAVSAPTAGWVVKVKVNWVEFAEITMPVPLLKVTVLFTGVIVLNPVPWMVRVVALLAILLLLKAIVGVPTMVATWTGAPLLPP